MKRFLSLTLCLAMVAAAGSAFAAKGTVERDSEDQQYLRAHTDHANVFTSTSSSSTMLLREQAGPDTFALLGGPGALSGKFSDANNVLPDRQGWVGVDATDSPVYWQVSDFNASNLNSNGAGNNAYWSGRSAAQELWGPGYGNNWNDIAIYESAVVVNQAAGQTVALNFVFNHETEPGYDYFNVEYDSAGTWTNVLRIDGTNRDVSNVFQAPGVTYTSVATGPITYAGNDYSTDGRIKIRFRVQSDGAWSDQDGSFPSDGAVQLDDVTISHSEGNFSEDFEGVAPFLLRPDKAAFAGDFSAVYARLSGIDPCRENTTPAIGFIDFGQAPPNGPGLDGTVSTGGTVSANWQYGIPGSWVVNHTGGLSNGEAALINFIDSPELDWDLPGTDDDGIDVSGAATTWSLWNHLPSDNGILFRWGVRSQIGGAWGNWRYSTFVYYGSNSGVWSRSFFNLTSRLEPGLEKIQMRLGVYDLADVFGEPGGDATPSPVFDSVRLYKYRIGGPTIATEGIRLAQSGFPVNGSVAASTQAERDALDIPFDMANDTNAANPANIAGDSVIVDVAAIIPGSAVTDIRMKWALRKNPFFEDAIRQAPARAQDVNVSAVGPVWTGEVLAGQTTTITGVAIPGRFFGDLPDVDFLYPGDQLHYYFEATDNGARVTTLPGNTSGFGVWDANGVSTYNRSFTVRGLPSIRAAGVQPRKLIYNDAFDRLENEEIASMMGQLGFTEGFDYDQYDVQGPTSGIHNGIGSAGVHGATPDQIEGYDTIIITWAALSAYLLSDGSNVGSNDKSNDIGTLTGWKNLPGRQRNTVYFGDYAAFGLTAAVASADAATYLQTVMGVDFNDQNVADEIGFQTAPRVQGLLAAFDTQFVAYGGCLGINEFDSIAPLGGAVAGHAWLSASGTPFATPAASVVFDRNVGLDRKVDITFPFGLGFLYGDTAIAGSGLSARSELMSDVFTYLSVPASGPNVTSAPPVRKAELSIVPNPFNPKTTVKFALPARGEATVKVFNLRGELVRTLHSGVLDAGEHPFVWNGTDNDGRSVSSGVYLVNAITEGFNGTKKAVLVK